MTSFIRGTLTNRFFQAAAIAAGAALAADSIRELTSFGLSLPTPAFSLTLVGMALGLSLLCAGFYGVRKSEASFPRLKPQ